MGGTGKNEVKFMEKGKKWKKQRKKWEKKGRK